MACPQGTHIRYVCNNAVYLFGAWLKPLSFSNKFSNFVCAMGDREVVNNYKAAEAAAAAAGDTRWADFTKGWNNERIVHEGGSINVEQARQVYDAFGVWPETRGILKGRAKAEGLPFPCQATTLSMQGANSNMDEATVMVLDIMAKNGKTGAAKAPELQEALRQSQRDAAAKRKAERIAEHEARQERARHAPPKVYVHAHHGMACPP